MTGSGGGGGGGGGGGVKTFRCRDQSAVFFFSLARIAFEAQPVATFFLFRQVSLVGVFRKSHPFPSPPSPPLFIIVRPKAELDYNYADS